MKKYLLIAILSALALTACAESEAKGNVNNSSEITHPEASQAESAESEDVSQKKTDVSKDVPESVDDSEPEYYASIDDSVDFDTYDEFIGSQELKDILAEKGLALEKLSDPVYNADKFTISAIKMYTSCVYYTFTDTETDTDVSVCLTFDKYKDFDEMKDLFDKQCSGEFGFVMINDYGADCEKEIYYVDGNHLSLSRLSKDGLSYDIFCEDCTEEELYAYADEIVF